MSIHFQTDFCLSRLTFASKNEGYFRSSFHSHAKRTKKTADRVWKPETDPLRRHLLASSFLDANWFQESGGKRSSLGPTKPSLQRGRVAAGDPLSNHSWSRTDRDHLPVTSQWGFSILERTIGLSECHYPETFPVAIGARGLAQVATAPRSLVDEDERQAAAAFTSALRFRLHRPGGLWPAARSSQGLQSAQARAQMLQPTALFRRPDKGLLAWRIAPRRRLHFQRRFRFANGLFCQASQRPQTDYNSRRQRVLRPQDHRVAGKQKSWVCHLRQAHATSQTEVFGAALYPAKQKPLHRRISLPTPALEKTLSLYRGAASPRRRAQQPAYLVQAGQIFLPGIRHQSHLETVKPLALLQWSHSGRTNHPRTQRKLSPGSNSDQRFPSQPGLLSPLTVGLQHRQLVQAPLPPSRVSDG